MDAGIAVQVPGTRTGESAIDAQPAQADAFERNIEPGGEIKFKRKWRKDNQYVKAQPAMNGEAGGGSIGLNIGTELQRIRGNGEITVRADAGIIAVADADREPVHIGNIKPGGAEMRVKPAQ